MVQGNTYLLNLTFPTQIDLNGSLADVYQQGGAPYRLYWKDHFCCFSPESFVSIENDQIHTTPVKGTSSLAEDPEGQGLLKNEKERAEHAMVVDLLRNDLAQVATDVSVNKFRYLEQVQTDHGALWQTESLIKGTMSADWPSHVGDILQKLTPPGSVTGMPKHETCKIIDAIENTPRGFYCGIFGYYQDHELHSAVSIRFIAQKGASFYYHSGGGITVDSNPRSEYEEMLLKVYLSGEKNAF
jgi:para-aminobenzoate synthetase component 1